MDGEGFDSIYIYIYGWGRCTLIDILSSLSLLFRFTFSKESNAQSPNLRDVKLKVSDKR